MLQEEGLNDFEDAPAKILQYASQKYSKENSSNFGEKMRVLELRHQKSVEAVFKNPDISDEFIHDQFKDSPHPQPKPVVQEDLKVLEEKGKDFNLEPEAVVNGEHAAHEQHQENHLHEEEKHHEPEQHHEEHAPEVHEHHQE